jgi:CDP-diacylglycerol---glycerol-3-phosphate 3-phosphatidyltransferase
MLNLLRPALNRLLTPLGEALARTPVTPNAITVTGTVGVAAGALWLFPTGHLFAGTVVCTIFVLADMLDGALARVTGTTGAWGAFLDSTLDRVGDAAIFAGLAVWLARGGHQALLAGVTLYCLVAGARVSYARARAEGLGVRADVGVAERSERLVIIFVSAGLTGLGVPFVLAVGLWALAVLSTVTFGQRVLVVRRAVGPGAANKAAGSGAAGNKAAGNKAAGSGAAGNKAAGSGAAGNKAAGSGAAGDGRGADGSEEGTECPR